MAFCRIKNQKLLFKVGSCIKHTKQTYLSKLSNASNKDALDAVTIVF